MVCLKEDPQTLICKKRFENYTTNTTTTTTDVINEIEIRAILPKHKNSFAFSTLMKKTTCNLVNGYHWLKIWNLLSSITLLLDCLKNLKLRAKFVIFKFLVTKITYTKNPCCYIISNILFKNIIQNFVYFGCRLLIYSALPSPANVRFLMIQF